MGSKRKVAGNEAPNLPVNGREANFVELQPHYQGVDDNLNLHIPLGGKSTKLDHKEMRVKDATLRTNARATTELMQATLKKTKYIAHQNTYNLFFSKDSLNTCTVVRRWLLLHHEHEFKRQEKEMATNKDVAKGEAIAPIGGV